MNGPLDKFPAESDSSTDKSFEDIGDSIGSEGNEEKSRFEKEQELWVRAKKTYSRMVLFVIVVLAIMTAYFTFLNFYIIAHAKPEPYLVRLGHTMPLSSHAEYQLFVKWDKITGLNNPVRPQLLLNGEEIVPVEASGKRSGLFLGVDKNYSIQVAFPRNCTPVLHKGRLVFQKVPGGGELPSLVTAPVSIEVTADLLKNWFVLKYWLVIVAAVLGILYLFCLINFPAPSGWLVFEDPTGTYCSFERSIPLKMRAVARFFPWKRSALNLKTLWKRGFIKLPLLIEGEVLFLAKNTPVLLTAPRRTKSSRIVRMPSRDEADIGYARDCGLMEVMYEDIPFAYVAGDLSTNIRFTFTRKPDRYRNA